MHMVLAMLQHYYKNTKRRKKQHSLGRKVEKGIWHLFRSEVVCHVEQLSTG